MNDEKESSAMDAVAIGDGGISTNCLTRRQLEILRFLAMGDSVREVAKKLHLAPKSVEGHKYRIMKRLGIHNRVHLCRFAIRNGVISP